MSRSWGEATANPPHLPPPRLPWVSACRGPAPSWGRSWNPRGWVTSPTGWFLHLRWSRYPVCPAASLPLLGPSLLQLRIGPGGSGKPFEAPRPMGKTETKFLNRVRSNLQRWGTKEGAHSCLPLMSWEHLEAGGGQGGPSLLRPAPRSSRVLPQRHQS